MFSSLRRQTLGSLMREAKQCTRDNKPIPLNVQLALDKAGVDVTELERNTRNGA